jgi:hypothetical protein
LLRTALHYVYPVIPTPETRGHVCQRFHHSTIFEFFKEQNQSNIK